MKNLGKVRLIAFLLVICTMVSLLPVNAIALTEEASVTSETEGAVNSAVAPKTVADEILEPVIIAEDITKRGETEKHFICDDGSYIAVSYPEAVHEQVNGEWVDIEYDVEAGNDGITPVDDSIKVKFANNTNSAKLVKLETGDYKISWTVEAENQEGDITEKVKLSKDAKATLKTNKEITKENKEKIKNEAKYTKEEVKRLKEQTKEKIKSLEKTNTVDIEQNEEVIQTNAFIENHNREQIQSVSFAQSNVEYVNAFGKGTTLRYVMSPGKINEEIVLEAYNGFKSYSMVIDTNGLTPVKTESGRVNLTDEKGNTVVTIASPFMYDSAENHSFDVDVTVTQESKKTWRITYTPDKEWLADENRVYPVVIDPTVTTNEVTYQNILDVSILTGQNTGVNFDGHYLALGYQNNTEYISYIQIQSLPEFPSGAKLTGAGLVMKFTEETEFYQNIGIYAASGNMDVDNFTWSNKPTVGEFLDNQGSIPGSLWITFCSKSFGSRINNAYNNGVGTLTYAIKFTQKKQGVTNFYSADAPIVDNRPYFTISYTTEFSEVTEGKYYIRNVKSGLYLSVRNNGNVAGSQVTQMDYSAEPSQIWEIDKAGTDTYYIIPQNATNLKLYAPASGSAVVSDVDHIRNQWRFSRIGGQYTISTVNQPWVVLDVDGQSMLEGATIYPYAYHGQTNQQWELIGTELLELDTPLDGRLKCNEERWYTYTPQKSDYYNIFAVGRMDSVGLLYCGSTLLSTSDCGGQDSNFLINYYLEKDVTYSIRVINAGEEENFKIMLLPCTYNDFSIIANDYCVNLQREIDIEQSNGYYNNWPASSFSDYSDSFDFFRTLSLRELYELALLTATGGWLVQYSNASSALLHYLLNTGSEYVIDSEELCADSKFVNDCRIKSVNSFLEAAEHIVPVGKTETLYYDKLYLVNGVPDSTDWHYTLGGFEYRIKATVTRETFDQYSAIIEYSIIDFYDWDREDFDMGNLPISPHELWELHHGGFARNFLTTGTSQLNIYWSTGERWGAGATVNKVVD